MRRLLLLETLPPGLRVSDRDTVAALTPQAAHELDRAGIPYRIPTDFGAEERLRREETVFFAETCSWLKRLDDLLRDSFPEFRSGDVRPATLYAYHWKTLLDNLYARGSEMETLLAEETSEVLFSAAQGTVYPPGRFLPSCLDPRGARARWARYLCGLRSIPFHQAGEHPSLVAPSRSVSRSLGRIRRRILRQIERMKGARRGPSRLTLLFLEEDYLGTLLKKSLRAGHRCLTAEPGWLPDLTGSGDPAWTRAAHALSAADSAVWDWPGRWFDMPLSSLLGPSLERWISEDLRQLAASLRPLAGRYDREGIDFVLTPFLTEPVHFAAVAACGLSEKTESVMIADGDGPEEGPAWDLIQLSKTRHYFVPDEESAAHFRERTNPTGGPTARVHVGGDRWRNYTALSRKPLFGLQRREGRWSLHGSRPPLPLPDSRPVVVLPLAKPDPDVRRLNRFDYDNVWYYRLLKEWIEMLAEETRYLFIIKPVPSAYQRESAAEKLARAQGKRHLLVSRTPFSKWLPWAARVVLDHPSTPMYETALAGVPLRLILPTTLRLRPEAMEKFESCVDWYEQPREAVEALRRYLDGPHTGTPRVEANETSTLEMLLRLRSGNPGPSAPRGRELEAVR